jgi:hypothetical protein
LPISSRTHRYATSRSCALARLAGARSYDPWRSAILLTGGDKSSDWRGWYKMAIPRAEKPYEEYLEEREAEEER